MIGFPGILGPAQYLHGVLDLARRVQDIRELVFLFVLVLQLLIWIVVGSSAVST